MPDPTPLASTYTAAIGTAPDVVAGDFCDVSVIVTDDEDRLTDEVAFAAETAIRTDHQDVLGVVEADAERVLAANGWRLTGPWKVTDNALYARAERT